ncbi:hypothetical protein BST97_03145 [Nonlabens spongiae]|uniref:Uncharacterized protein n=1 Tax=Nonlabens spongiae TaxID=331648 RepID=A0A1W6MHK5_9FLAO|nr:hypothetical protein BST97_03145 [Nonlabens spongiae]
MNFGKRGILHPHYLVRAKVLFKKGLSNRVHVALTGEDFRFFCAGSLWVKKMFSLSRKKGIYEHF